MASAYYRRSDMSEVSYTSVGKNHEWRLSHAYNRGGELPRLLGEVIP